ncbi:T9SS type A sorting domain-containing protein [Flavobacterium humi]|uniref:T9SS type A sorting domain-containing protein n=1 Tax=Flavobacterium humi TaxID=2562683 RepID=A0A4Z0LD89_9FLAO|nr:T9SS type A sorting domain-containing protein [Flavobacterium humi]
MAALGVQDFEFSNYFNVYPNPVHDVLTISAKETIEISSISIYNTIGQLVMVIPNAKNIKTVDVSGLAPGNYFIKTHTDKGTANTKFIKN